MTIPFSSSALDARLAKTVDLQISIEQNKALHPEGCRIVISNSAPIKIIAATAAGAYYALTTLERLRRADNSYPNGVFEDSPALDFRGFHLTLGSNFMPNFARMKEIIVQLSEWRINTLVLEYDDRFPWKKNPELVHPNTWSIEQLRELLQLASEHFIEVIPLLDSLGHAEQYLRHPQHLHLRELSDNIHEMCPQRPETFEFITGLWDEVLELHSGSRYAHISGDEVFRLGNFCPQCAEAAGNGKLAEIYCDYYTKLSRYIVERGFRPIIWGDMLLKYPESIDSMPRDIIINDWCYTRYDADRWDFNLLECELHGGTSPVKRKLFAASADARVDGTFRAYPSLHFFRQQGFEVIGATAASHNNYTIPQQTPRIANQRRMSQEIQEHHGLGILLTFWSDNGSVEGSLYSAFAAAEYSWQPFPARDQALNSYFVQNVLALPHNANPIPAVDAMYDFCAGNPLAKTSPQILKASSPPDAPGKYFYELARLNQELGEIDQKLITWAIERITSRPASSRRELSLAGIANTTVKEALPAGCDILPLSEGVYRLGDRSFLLSPSQVLSLSRQERRYPSGEAELPVNASATEFELVTYGYYIQAGQNALEIQINYQDGSCANVPLPGKDTILDWWGYRDFGKHATPFLSLLIQHDQPVQVYLSTIPNPHPERIVRSLTLVAGNSQSTVVVILGAAATVCHTSGFNPARTELSAIESAVRDNLSRQEQLFLQCSLKGEFENVLAQQLERRRRWADIFMD